MIENKYIFDALSALGVNGSQLTSLNFCLCIQRELVWIQ